MPVLTYIIRMTDVDIGIVILIKLKIPKNKKLKILLERRWGNRSQAPQIKFGKMKRI